MNAPIRLLTVASLLGLVLSCDAAPAPDQAPEGGRKLTVSTNAAVYADPDAAVISFTVTTTAATSKEAREGTGKRSKAIKDAIANLTAAGVTVDVVPAPLNPLVAADPAPDGSQIIQGYEAESRCSVTVREKDVEKLRVLVVRVGDVAVENGAVGSTDERPPTFRLPRRPAGLGGAVVEPPQKVAGPSVEWLCENDGEARKQAVKKAVDEALTSARAVAGSDSPKVTEIDVQKTTPISIRRANSSEGGSASGRVPIEVSVTVTCSY